MIRLVAASKSFNRRSALRDVSIHVRAGEIFGLLGHNGAGKSTAIGILLDQVHPDSGHALIASHPVRHARSRALASVGAIFESPGFYDYLTGRQNIALLAQCGGPISARQIAEAVERVGLQRRIGDPVRTYSRGMRQQLALACAIVQEPGILILDEPLDGLDPENAPAARELLRDLNARRGVTILLTSNRLHHIDLLCQRVAILKQGRLVFDGAWEDVAGTGRPIHLEIDDWTGALPILERHGARRVAPDRVIGPADLDPATLLAALGAAGARVRAFQPHRLTLEDFYLHAVTTRS